MADERAGFSGRVLPLWVVIAAWVGWLALLGDTILAILTHHPQDMPHTTKFVVLGTIVLVGATGVWYYLSHGSKSKKDQTSAKSSKSAPPLPPRPVKKQPAQAADGSIGNDGAQRAAPAKPASAALRVPRLQKFEEKSDDDQDVESPSVMDSPTQESNTLLGVDTSHSFAIATPLSAHSPHPSLSIGAATLPARLSTHLRVQSTPSGRGVTPPPRPPRPSPEDVARHTDSQADSTSSAVKTPEVEAKTSKDVEETPEQAAVREAKRTKVVHELFETERAYTEDLGRLVNHFVIPCKTGKDGALKLSDAQCQEIFSNIEMLAQLHQNFLAQLQDVGEDGDIAQVIADFTPYFKMYSVYISHYDKGLDALDKLKANSKFQKFLQSKRRDPAVKCLDLMSFLIMPVQRIPRYELLLKEIIKRTAKGDASGKLELAFKKVHSVAVELNERKRHIESMTRVLALQHHIKQCRWEEIPGHTFMIPTRRMVHKGKVLVRQLSGSDAAKAQELATAAAASQQAAAIGSSSHSSSVPSVSQQALVGVHALSWALRDTPDKNTKERQVVLFNDCIIWASRADKFKGCMVLSKATITVMGDRWLEVRGPPANASSPTVLWLYFATPAQRTKWTKELAASLSASQEAAAAEAKLRLRARENAHSDRRRVHSNITERLKELQTSKSKPAGD